MLIFKGDRFNIKSLHFCCSDMAEYLLTNQIYIGRFTDHAPPVFIRVEGKKGILIKNCPFCGAEIKTND